MNDSTPISRVDPDRDSLQNAERLLREAGIGFTVTCPGAGGTCACPALPTAA